MNVTATQRLSDSRNGRRCVVTPWNKCLGPGCENSVNEYVEGRRLFKREDARYCSNACRQRAYRKRKSAA